MGSTQPCLLRYLECAEVSRTSESAAGDVAKLLSDPEHLVNGIRAQDIHQMEQSLALLEEEKGGPEPLLQLCLPHPVPILGPHGAQLTIP